MPTYEFKNLNTNEVWEDFMSISACEEYLNANKNIQQLPASPAIISGAMGKKSKPDNGFRDILKRIKKKHSGGFTKANIETF